MKSVQKSIVRCTLVAPLIAVLAGAGIAGTASAAEATPSNAQAPASSQAAASTFHSVWGSQQDCTDRGAAGVQNFEWSSYECHFDKRDPRYPWSLYVS